MHIIIKASSWDGTVEKTTCKDAGEALRLWYKLGQEQEKTGGFSAVWYVDGCHYQTLYAIN
jgi:hypothetical protein